MGTGTLGKKFGQFVQWTGERMGTAERTNVSEDFRRLDGETESRKDGVDKLTIALADYAKTLDKRSSQEKGVSAIAMLAQAMLQQGNFHGSSTMIGIALLKIGETEDRIKGLQEEFGLLMEVTALQTSMKDYAHLKKKLENRRLDYDAKLNKLNKSKKEKPGLEEEMKTAQAKYNETLADVEAIMSTFSEREDLLLAPLIEFAQAQYDFFAKSMEGLKELQEYMSEEKLQVRALEGRESADRTTVRRKSSTLKTVLPARLEASPIKAVATPRHEEVELPEAPKPITNLSREPSTRREPPPSSDHDTAEKVIALYDFAAENDGEMSIKKGAMILVTKHIDDGWWHGKCDGHEGMFPANYVKPIKEDRRPNEGGRRMPPAAAVAKSQAPPPASASACRDCGCQDFAANVFKPGKCNNCFHVH